MDLQTPTARRKICARLSSELTFETRETKKVSSGVVLLKCHLGSKLPLNPRRLASGKA